GVPLCASGHCGGIGIISINTPAKPQSLLKADATMVVLSLSSSPSSNFSPYLRH
ncbi:MAG: hypothetical protein SGPRY_009351, partial [Prymnesium sp.]